MMEAEEGSSSEGAAHEGISSTEVVAPHRQQQQEHVPPAAPATTTPSGDEPPPPPHPHPPQRSGGRGQQQQQRVHVGGSSLQESEAAAPRLNNTGGDWQTTITQAGRDFFFPQRPIQQHPGTPSRITSRDEADGPGPAAAPTNASRGSRIPRGEGEGGGAVAGGDDDARSRTDSFDFNYFAQQEQEDLRFVHHFWRTYDDILILSLFTQVGIVFRLASSTWFTFFDQVFSADSALFVNLPLNALSCFLMGALCSGERLMEIIATRFSPPHLQQSIVRGTATGRESLGSCDSNEMMLMMEEAAENSADDENNMLDDDEELEEMDMDHSSPGRRSFAGLRRRRRRRRRTTTRNSRRRGRRRAKRHKEYFHAWQPPVHLNEELRDVQLLALERRIRASKCLLLFPVRKQDFDVMEHYFHEGYKKNENLQRNRRGIGSDEGSFDDHHHLSFDLELTEEHEAASDRIAYKDEGEEERQQHEPSGTQLNGGNDASHSATPPPRVDPLLGGGSQNQDSEASVKQSRQGLQAADPDEQRRGVSSSSGTPGDNALAADVDSGIGNNRVDVANNANDIDQHHEGSELQQNREFDQIIQGVQDVHANVSENISRLRRVNLADGWDVGTTPDDMSDDLMLGLRDGFCGALSSFSSWNSAMVNLMRNGQVGQAFVGYMLGLQLPIIAYRFGQHVAVYIFILRCRRETKRDERRGYGIRLSMNDVSDRDDSAGLEDDDNLNNENEGESDPNNPGIMKDSSAREIPSVRAIVTALFIMALVTQCTSLSFFQDPDKQALALSLLFSPLGVLARWRLSKFNSWRPTFPIGTFSANILACTLSGSLGTLLAGNPGPREQTVLLSLVNGFGGTLSSLATFIVEVLAGIDPILFRFDGVIYAVLSIFWAWVVGFVFSASVDWADETTAQLAPDDVAPVANETGGNRTLLVASSFLH